MGMFEVIYYNGNEDAIKQDLVEAVDYVGAARKSHWPDGARKKVVKSQNQESQ